jgi:hypothetical protein
MAKKLEQPSAPPLDPFPSAPGAGGQPRVPPPPKAKTSKPATAIAAVVVALVVAWSGFAVQQAVRPGPCDAAGFVSESFGYCVTPPDGWTGTSATREAFGVDAFRRDTSPVVVYVEAIQLAGEDLESVTGSVRQLDDVASAKLDDVSTSSLDGEPTSEWTVTEPSPQGARTVREIIVVRDEIAWRIQVADIEGAPDEDYAQAQQLLDSFRFA